MSSLLLPLVLLLAGLALGTLIAAMVLRAGSHAAETRARQTEAQAASLIQELAAARDMHLVVTAQKDALRDASEQVRVAHARLEAELAAIRERQASLEDTAARAVAEHGSLRAELSQAREALREATTQLAADREAAEARLAQDRIAAAERLETERQAAAEKLALLAEARIDLGNQFKTLAAEIFDEKSKRFGEQNKTSMDALLSPLREKLGEFQMKVEALKEDGVAGRSELKTHIDSLRSLNERLSAEASSLVSALKGSSKTQGDWGEVLLERMLEDAGLRKGEEYRVQESFTRADGTRARPDVILNLPGDKHLVVDAKISLVDYNAYCECTDDAARAISLAKHVASLREHIRGLSKREYQRIYQLQSIDFVLLFVPIEPAYLLAISKDGRLWQEAWANDVLLVSPGTLFPVIRTVAHLWRQEQQNRNWQEISDRGAMLYDKLAAFAADLVKVGAGLDTARESYDKAMSKLSTGKGNAISQAEKLRELGVKPSKRLPKELLSIEDALALPLEAGHGSSELFS